MKFSVKRNLAVLVFFVGAVCAKNPSTKDSKQHKASSSAQDTTNFYLKNHTDDEPNTLGYNAIVIADDKHWGGTPILTQWDNHYKKRDVNFVAETALNTPAAVKLAYNHPKTTEKIVENMEQGRGPVNRAVSDYFQSYNSDVNRYLEPQNDAAMNTAYKESHPKEKAAINDPDEKVIQDEKIAEGGFIISDKYRNEAKKHPEKAATQAVNVGNSARIIKSDINFDLKSDLKNELKRELQFDKGHNKSQDIDAAMAPALTRQYNRVFNNPNPYLNEQMQTKQYWKRWWKNGPWNWGPHPNRSARIENAENSTNMENAENSTKMENIVDIYNFNKKDGAADQNFRNIMQVARPRFYKEAKENIKFDAEIAKTYNDTFNKKDDKKEDKKLKKDFKKDKKIEKRIIKINNTPERSPLVPIPQNKYTATQSTPAQNATIWVQSIKTPVPTGQKDIAWIGADINYGGTPFKKEWTDHTHKQDQTLVAEIVWDNPALAEYMYKHSQDIKPDWQNVNQGSEPLLTYINNPKHGNKIFKYVTDDGDTKKQKTMRQNYVKNNPKREKEYTAFTDTNTPVDNKTFQDERLAANVSIIDPKYRTEAKNHPEKAATQAVDVGHYIPDGMIRGSIRGAIKFNQNNTKKKDAEYDSVPFFFGLVSPKTGEIRPPVMHAAKKHAPQSIKSAKASIAHNVKADEGIKHSISFVEKNGEKLPEIPDIKTIPDKGIQFQDIEIQLPLHHIAVDGLKDMHEKIAEENKKLSEDENKRSEEIDSEKETEESDNEDLDRLSTDTEFGSEGGGMTDGFLDIAADTDEMLL